MKVVMVGEHKRRDGKRRTRRGRLEEREMLRVREEVGVAKGKNEGRLNI